MLAVEPLKINYAITDLKTSHSNINYLRESYIRFYNEKIQSIDDCNCGNNDIKKFICDIIDAILEAFYFIMDIFQIFLYHFIPNIAGYLDIIKFFLPIIFLYPVYIVFNCGPIGPPPWILF